MKNVAILRILFKYKEVSIYTEKKNGLIMYRQNGNVAVVSKFFGMTCLE